MAYSRCASVFLTRRTALTRNSGFAGGVGEAGGAFAAGVGEDGRTTSERDADRAADDDFAGAERGRGGVRDASGRGAGLWPAFGRVALFLGDGECTPRARVGDIGDAGLSSDSGSDSGDVGKIGSGGDKLSATCTSTSASADAVDLIVAAGGAMIASGRGPEHSSDATPDAARIAAADDATRWRVNRLATSAMVAATAAVSSSMAASRRVTVAGRLPLAATDWRASRAASRCEAAADSGVPASFMVCVGTERSSGTARREVLSDGGGGRDQLGRSTPLAALETAGKRAAAALALALALVGAVDGRRCCCCAPAGALVDEATDDITLQACCLQWSGLPMVGVSLVICVVEFEFFREFFQRTPSEKGGDESRQHDCAHHCADLSHNRNKSP
jgi:hypothetical protein